MLSPIYEGKLVTQFQSFDAGVIIKIAVFLAVLRIAIALIIHLWSETVLKLNGKVNFDLKQKMMQCMLNLETTNFDNNNSGLFIARVNKDTSDLSELLDDVTDDLADILLNVSFILYIFVMNIYIGLFLVANILIIYLFVSRKLFHYKRYSAEYRAKDENVVGVYTDVIRGVRDIKNLNLKPEIMDRVDAQQVDAIHSSIKAIHTRRSWDRLKSGIQHVLDLIFILLSVYLISIKNMDIATFLIVFLYKKNVLNLITCISNAREKLANGKVAAARVFDIIDFEQFSKEVYGSCTLQNIKGDITFEDVSFSYIDGQSLFHNLNFKIEANKMTAIVGKSGEGKSTILDLISKNYTADKGKIAIDDVSIQDLTEESIRNNISIVSQSPYIFNLSIKDNIKLVDASATDEQIIEVCKKAQIHSFIMNMKDGYDTVVGENGVTLSGGQKQRLAIARALIKKSKIILLDEATSSLDNDSQNKIKNVMKDLTKDHTVIVVAHRLSTIVDADDILVFDDHDIVAKGSHSDLMKTCDIYHCLYEIEQD